MHLHSEHERATAKVILSKAHVYLVVTLFICKSNLGLSTIVFLHGSSKSNLLLCMISM